MCARPPRPSVKYELPLVACNDGARKHTRRYTYGYPPRPPKNTQNAVVTSPVTMWLDAIDVGLSRLAALSAPPPPLGNKEPACSGKEAETEQQGGPGPVTTWGRSVLARVRAVSVSGQQHGTVFWKAGAAERLKGLAGLGPKDTLVEVRASPPASKPPSNVCDSLSTSWCVPLSRLSRRYCCSPCFLWLLLPSLLWICESRVRSGRTAWTSNRRLWRQSRYIRRRMELVLRKIGTKLSPAA